MKLCIGGVSLTLRHRLECKIKTVDTVSTVDNSDLCPLSPTVKSEQFLCKFDVKDKLPWLREKETFKQMLVSHVIFETVA